MVPRQQIDIAKDNLKNLAGPMSIPNITKQVLSRSTIPSEVFRILSISRLFPHESLFLREVESRIVALIRLFVQRQRVNLPN
jgi:hypothetical protein